MKLFRFDSTLLRSQIDEALPAGVQELLQQWELRYPNVPDRSTVYRWLNGQLPGSKESLWSLASILDVDPIALIDFRVDNAHNLQRLISSVQGAAWGRNKALAYLHDFLGRKRDWPPRKFPADYFNRDWQKEYINHDSGIGRNFYRRILLAPVAELGQPLIQTFHFAYRQRGVFNDMWLEYGVVCRSREVDWIVHINGYFQEHQRSGNELPTLVETWFGPSDAEFCVVSLHPLTLELTDNEGDALRFPA